MTKSVYAISPDQKRVKFLVVITQEDVDQLMKTGGLKTSTQNITGLEFDLAVSVVPDNEAADMMLARFESGMTGIKQ